MEQWVFIGFSDKDAPKYYFRDLKGEKWGFSEQTIKTTILWSKIPDGVQSAKSSPKKTSTVEKKKNFNILYNKKNFIFPKKDCLLNVEIIRD